MDNQVNMDKLRAKSNASRPEVIYNYVQRYTAHLYNNIHSKRSKKIRC